MKLKHEEEMGVDLMAQHALLRKNLHILQKDVDTQKDEIKKLRDKEARLTDTIKSLEKDIHGHKKEIREREETISDKEKRIFDLKKKNQELEKFRFVLDYKIKELKLQIAPRETEIATMRKQGEEMNLELEQYHKSNLALNLMIEELKLKLEGLRRELLDQKDRSAMNDRVHEKFRRDLQEIWIVRDFPMQLKEFFLRIYREYVQEDSGKSSGSDAKGGGGKSKKGGLSANGEDPQVTYNRDREMLERSLEGLKRALKTDVISNKREVTKMMRERAMLTKELNVLRRDAGELRLQGKAIEQVGLIGPKMDITVLTETLTLLGINISKRATVLGTDTGGSNKNKNNVPGGTSLYNNSTMIDRVESRDGLGGNTPGVTGMGVRGMSGDMTDRGGNAGTRTRGAEKPPSGTNIPHHRTIALRTTSASGRVESMLTAGDATGTSGILREKKLKNDMYEAMREIQMQNKQMQQVEVELRNLCQSLGIDPEHLLAGINSNLGIS